MEIEIFPTSAFIFPILTLYSKVNRRISSMGDFFFNYTEKILQSILCNSNLFTTFAAFQVIGITGMTFINKKVLLKLSSVVNSRKISNGTKMIAVAPHRRYICPHEQCGLLDIVYRCGLLFYPL